MTMRGGRRAPLTLRDFLELACESSSDGFRSYPRCCDAAVLPQQQKPAARPQVVELSRSPSWSPSAFFSFPGNKSPLARISSLSRSFSRRISFWRRHRDDLDDDRDSCGFPSPLVSSCSSSSSSSSELLDIIVIEETSSAAPVAVFEEPSAEAATSPSSSTTGAAGNGQDEALDAGDPAVGRRKLETMEDKQQLSPVSVLDFPFDDDDGDEEERSDAGTCSPSSFQHHHNCASANLQREKKKAAQHKIRRFDDDGPTTTEAVDLGSRFTTTTSDSGGESVDGTHLPSKNNDDSDAAKTTTEEHQKSIDEEQSQSQDEDEYRLLARLLDDGEITAAAIDEITEWLLLDFFAEGIARLFRSSSVVGTTTANKHALHDDLSLSSKVTAALLDTAADWLLGAGPQWGIGDVMFSGESALKDMERSRRWMCVRQEEQDVGEELEAFVMDRMLDELVAELAQPLVVPR